MSATHSPLEILVPLDFSQGGREALRVARELRAHRGGGVTAINVVLPPTHLDGRPSWIESEKAQRLLEARELTRAFLSEQGIDDVDVLSAGGDPAREVAEQAARMKASMIVMPAHGKGWMDRLVIGSVTERVARFARCPVLVLPPPSRAERAPADWASLSRVLVPYDFGDPDRRAVNYARSFVDDDSKLTAVHVTPLPSPPVLEAAWNPFDPKKMLENTRGALQMDLAKQGMPHVRAHSRLGLVGPELAAAIEAEDAELLVVSSHGRSGLGRLLMGSVAEGLLRRATCPVIVLHHEDVSD